jgi:predicted esterase
MVSDMRHRCFILVIITLGLISACSASPPTPIITAPIDPTSTTSPWQVTSDVIFASSVHEGGESWTLDIYGPDETGNLPVVVFLHGFGARKEGYIKESQAIAESGALVYTLNWPTLLKDLAEREGGKGFREMFEVAACGISFAKATASDYGGDPSHVTLIGFAYGGYLGIWVTLGADGIHAAWEDYAVMHEGPPPQVVCERDQDSIEVDVFIGVAGAYAIVENYEEKDNVLWEIISPFAYFGDELEVPIRLLHGERDTTQQPRHSEEFRDIILDAGYDTELVMFDGIHQVPPELTAELVQELARNR